MKMNDMNYISRFLIIIFIGFLAIPLFGHINPERQQAPAQGQDATLSYRNDCAMATSQIDMSVNNVRARLLNGGDVWWDLEDGRYIVPKVDPLSGIPAVSSIFAGAVWLGGFDDIGNLKLAAQDYRDPENNINDFWPGPLTSIGVTSSDTCLNWDRFFKVSGENIRAHIKLFEEARNSGLSIDCDAIPDDISRSSF
jgi:hypothetical protein